MPVNIRGEVQLVKGLPSDDEIREWMQKLILCTHAIRADIDYAERNILRDHDISPAEFAAELEAEASALYLNAIVALYCLLPEGEKKVTELYFSPRR